MQLQVAIILDSNLELYSTRIRAEPECEACSVYYTHYWRSMLKCSWDCARMEHLQELHPYN